MTYSNVIVGITISCCLFVLTVSLKDVGSLAVGAFDLVNCSLSVVGFVPVFNVCQQVSLLKCRFGGYMGVLGL